MTYQQIWTELDRDLLSDGVVRRRVRPDIRHDVHFCQDKPSGRRTVTMALHGPVGQLWRTVRDSRGVEVRITLKNTSEATVRLTEKDRRYREIFTALADDLVAALPTEPAAPALDAVAERITRWQSCLEAAADGLGEERQAGLFAELVALLEVLTPAIGFEAALAAWCGPQSALQDFQRGGVAMEVKATRTSTPAHVVVSSERQLDTTGHEQLFLLAVTLDARAEGTGRMLPDLVTQVRAASVALPAAAPFDDLLLAVGYLDLHAPRYRTRFTVRTITGYAVENGFPRIVEGDLPPGVGRLTYHLDLGACEPWRTDLNRVTAAFAQATGEAQP